MIWSKVRIALAVTYVVASAVLYLDVFVWHGFDPKPKTGRIENGCGAPAHTGGRYKK